jgi:hypothetical protein
MIINKIDIDAVRSWLSRWFRDHFTAISADTLEWLAIIVIHCATLPSLLALMTGLSDHTPGIDVVMFMWSGLVLLFSRSIVLKNTLNIVTNGFGFIAQSVLMALILFK